MRLKIESGVPIPSRGRGLNETSKTLLSMKKGDSVLLSCSIFSARQYGARYFGKGGYAARPEGRKVRLWRTK